MSLRKAINEMCKYCIYDEFAAGTWRKQVEECTCVKCPLYRHRPLPMRRNLGKIDQKKVKDT